MLKNNDIDNKVEKISNSKKEFLEKLKKFSKTLTDYVSTNSGTRNIKGFIDIENIRNSAFPKI